jgi:flagellar hook-length control protein FliK
LEQNLDILSKLLDPSTNLDAALKKLGLEQEQILRIKSYLSKEPETVKTAESKLDTGSKPLSAAVMTANTNGTETASDQAKAGQQNTEPKIVQPVKPQTAGQPVPAVFQTTGLQETDQTQPVSETAGTQADIFSQLVDKAAAGIQEGKYRMSIQLRPEHLGKVTIQMVMDADGLVVRIHTQNDAVESAISNQIAQLEQALKDKGIAVVRMEVTQNNHQDGNGQSGNPHDSKRQRHRGYTDQGDVDGIDAAGREMFMTLQPYLFNNSVEFRA